MLKYDDALFGLRVPDLVRQDAGHAIIAHALVDQMLGTLILAFLPNKLSDSAAAKLFSRRGPFSSLFAKIAFAPALGLICDETRKDLKGIMLRPNQTVLVRYGTGPNGLIAAELKSDDAPGPPSH